MSSSQIEEAYKTTYRANFTPGSSVNPLDSSLQIEIDELYAYFSRLEAAGFELINHAQLRKTIVEKGFLNVYCGYQVNGQMHLGGLLPFSILLRLAEFKWCRAYVLLADYHTRLNNKNVVPSLELTIRKIITTTKSSIRVIKSSEDGHGFYHTVAYAEAAARVMSRIAQRHVKKAARFFNREDWTAMSLAECLYASYQVADIQYIGGGIDLAVGGMDQRKIHMLHNDRVRKSAYLHTPLISTGGPTKMSKSHPKGVVGIYENIRQRLSEQAIARFNTVYIATTGKTITEFVKEIGGYQL